MIHSIISNRTDDYSIMCAVAARCLKYTIEKKYYRTTIEAVESLLVFGGSGRVQR